MKFKHAISWFEIPATDLDRAQDFYERIFDIVMISMDFPNIRMRMFPVEDQMTGIGGAIVSAESFYNPSSSDGVLIYLNGNPDLQTILDKVEAVGGKVIMPKTEISPEYGFMGVFIDSEGNRIGLHSTPQ